MALARISHDSSRCGREGSRNLARPSRRGVGSAPDHYLVVPMPYLLSGLRCGSPGLGFGFWGSRFWVWSYTRYTCLATNMAGMYAPLLRLCLSRGAWRVQGSRCLVWGLRFGVWGWGFRVLSPASFEISEGTLELRV